MLVCHQPFTAKAVHSVEAFGPVCTLMPYEDNDQAVALMQLGEGSLAASVFSFDHQIAFDLIHRAASYHGRMLLLNRESARESTPPPPPPPPPPGTVRRCQVWCMVGQVAPVVVKS